MWKLWSSVPTLGLFILSSPPYKRLLPLHALSISTMPELVLSMESFRKLFLSLVIQFIAVAVTRVWAKPVTFTDGFTITWADSHVKQLQGGSSIQLILDQSSGSGFASKNKYLFGRVSMKIKLVSGDSAGTVTAFYMKSDTDNVRDELDFEFLGNRSGQPYTVQTNVYANGKGDREQRVNLWFDPAADYHTYSILWNHCHVIFFVDEVPIRVFKNNERRGVAFPTLQPMAVYSTLWEADDWATRGGLEKIDWSKAPFYAYYTEFDMEGCVAGAAAVDTAAACASNAGNWWEGPAYCQLSAGQARLYRWVRLYHVIYDYCTDKSRYAVTPAECMAGI